MLHKVLYAVLFAGLAGCASNHDLSQGSNMLGGGYKQQEAGSGLYYIYARTNHAPWANYSAARTSWRDVATKACGSDEYNELAIEEDEKNTGLQSSSGVSYIVTERKGYARCDSSSLTESEVSKIMAKGVIFH